MSLPETVAAFTTGMEEKDKIQQVNYYSAADVKQLRKKYAYVQLLSHHVSCEPYNI